MLGRHQSDVQVPCMLRCAVPVQVAALLHSVAVELCTGFPFRLVRSLYAAYTGICQGAPLVRLCPAGLVWFAAPLCVPIELYDMRLSLGHFGDLCALIPTVCCIFTVVFTVIVLVYTVGRMMCEVTRE